MMDVKAMRPQAGEYAEYYGKYISLVPAGDLLSTLARQLEETLALLKSIPETQGERRYAAGKWSIKELVGHMIDSERVFAYRALRFARHDPTPLSGFDQDHYVQQANFDARPLSELAEEYEHVRRASLLLFRHLDGDAWARRGTANDNEVSVRALAFIIAGHEAHHVQILRSRYL